MSYPKKQTSSNQNSVKGPHLSEQKREKLVKIQQREQLKGLLVTKFLEKYGGKNKIKKEFIDQVVLDFIKNEKVTEDSLKRLEQRIRDFDPLKQQDSNKLPHLTGKISEKPEHLNSNTLQNQIQDRNDAKSTVSRKSKDNEKAQSSQNLNKYNANQHNEYYDEDEYLSVASSKIPRSVYQVADEDDEWALITKFDNQLYEKE